MRFPEKTSAELAHNRTNERGLIARPA